MLKKLFTTGVFSFLIFIISACGGPDFFDFAEPVLTIDVDPLDQDNDGDGAPLKVDCDDGNPDIRPGKIDILHDDIDQNCSGSDKTIKTIVQTKDSDGNSEPERITTYTFENKRLISTTTEMLLGPHAGTETVTFTYTFDTLNRVATMAYESTSNPGLFTYTYEGETKTIKALSYTSETTGGTTTMTLTHDTTSTSQVIPIDPITNITVEADHFINIDADNSATPDPIDMNMIYGYKNGRLVLKATDNHMTGNYRTNIYGWSDTPAPLKFDESMLVMDFSIFIDELFQLNGHLLSSATYKLSMPPTLFTCTPDGLTSDCTNNTRFTYDENGFVASFEELPAGPGALIETFEYTFSE